HGFLRCGICGNLVYTHTRSPNDWYVCKSRTTAERKLRERDKLDACTNPYMRRERLEASIDLVFSEHLRNAEFVEEVAEAYLARCNNPHVESDTEAAKQQLASLEQKQKRLANLYARDLISLEELDDKIAEIEATKNFCTAQAEKPTPSVPTITGEGLAD